jgi:enoyl-CoA hydratase
VWPAFSILIQRAAWPLLIGPARAKEFLMRGHSVNGADAFKMGMVNYAVAPEQADELPCPHCRGRPFGRCWRKLSIRPESDKIQLKI